MSRHFDDEVDDVVWGYEVGGIRPVSPDPGSLHSEPLGPIYVGQGIVPDEHHLLGRCEPGRLQRVPEYPGVRFPVARLFGNDDEPRRACPGPRARHFPCWLGEPFVTMPHGTCRSFRYARNPLTSASGCTCRSISKRYQVLSDSMSRRMSGHSLSRLLARIHRTKACGKPSEEARGCSFESGIMVLKQQTDPRTRSTQ